MTSIHQATVHITLTFVFSLALGSLAVAETKVSKAEKSQAAGNSRANETWDSVSEFWKRQAARGAKMSYPKLRFDKRCRVGDVGVGDKKQSLTILERRGEDEFLVSAWEPLGKSNLEPTHSSLFLFRRFDFSRIALGESLPAPGLCQVSGTYGYLDSASGLQRSVMVVEPVAKTSLPLPKTIAKKELVNSLRDTQAAKPVETGQEPGSKVKQVAMSASAATQTASAATPNGPPTFEIRNWVRLNQYQNLKGKLLGVGSDAVWVRVGGGKTLRVPLQNLDPRDRDHALAKKEAILVYRQQKDQAK